MDLTHQVKLSKAEWESIEVSVSEDEKKTLRVIMDGYDNINARYNDNMSMMQLLKMTETPEFHAYFYNQHFEPIIQKIMDDMTTTTTTKNNKKTKKDAVVTTTTPTTQKTEKTNEIVKICEEWKKENTTNKKQSQTQKLKKADLIRVQHLQKTISSQKQLIVEFAILEFCEKMLQLFLNNDGKHGFYLYTLIQLKKSTIPCINTFVNSFTHVIVQHIMSHTSLTDVLHHSPEFIEKNPYILKYEDITLYSHQKQLFSTFKSSPRNVPKLVFYTAPTGTGKTVSPIGLAMDYKIIFVCVARHVGLALAKTAISVGKKVAFAFGCETASDIRLHYFSAVNYTKDKKTGGIKKVDNSVGTNVEIMICDVKSYLTAMYYMLSFHTEQNVVTYWDEPTITMDYETHALHEIIHHNWTENRVSKMVLSCATLPNEDEIIETVMDFRAKFDGAEIHTITSYDCKKSICLLNKDMKCCVPHLMFSRYDELNASVEHCFKNKTLMRYFDLTEVIRCIEYVNMLNLVCEPFTMTTYFDNDIQQVSMFSIKMYYLEMLRRIPENKWAVVHEQLTVTQTNRFYGEETTNFQKTQSVDSVPSIVATTTATNVISQHNGTLTRLHSVSCFTPTQRTDVNAHTPATTTPATTKGVLLTTADAHTLTDGPTVFLVEDVEKIAKFLLQHSKIPEKVFSEIMSKITDNETIQRKINFVEKTIEDVLGKDKEKDKKMEKEVINKETVKLMLELENLQHQLKTVNLDAKYVPNTRQHQTLWVHDCKIIDTAFVPRIDERTVAEIMALEVENHMKLLLLLGIGVFMADNANATNTQSKLKYMEIMKTLATEQKLYLIIAQSDYVYGTNYQFCHGFLGKDLTNMTQQKTIQAMGRIGRNKMQQNYTLRFRDDDIIRRLFTPATKNTEAVVMSRLFSGSV